MLCLQGVNKAYYEGIILSGPIKLYFCEILKFTKTTNTVFFLQNAIKQIAVKVSLSCEKLEE